jgi:hypothetical protein
MNGPSRSRGSASNEHRETVSYIHALLGQLRAMAKRERCEMLAYLIEMAYVEAGDIVRRERPSPTVEQKRNSAA